MRFMIFIVMTLACGMLYALAPNPINFTEEHLTVNGKRLVVLNRDGKIEIHEEPPENPNDPPPNYAFGCAIIILVSVGFWGGLIAWLFGRPMLAIKIAGTCALLLIGVLYELWYRTR